MRRGLTEAQRELLLRVARYDTQQVVRNYSTARVLRDKGLISIAEVEPPYGWMIKITSAGAQAALAMQEDAGRSALDLEGRGDGKEAPR